MYFGIWVDTGSREDSVESAIPSGFIVVVENFVELSVTGNRVGEVDIGVGCGALRTAATVVDAF